MKKSSKKLLVVVAAVVFSMNMAAQFSINLGYSNTEAVSRINVLGVKSTDKQVINGASLGFAYDLSLMKVLGLNMGLDYTFSYDKKGIKTDDKFTGYSTQYHTLGVPVRLMVNIPFGDDYKFFIYGGPRFTFDVAGSVQSYLANEKVGDPISLYKDTELSTIDDFKDLDPTRFNILVGPGAGFQIKNFIVKGGYDWGIINMNTNKDTQDAHKLYKNNWYVTVGVAF